MEVVSIRSVQVDLDGLRLRVLDEGAGLPVLLLHGFPDRAEMWRYVAARLRQTGRRTVAVDLPGFGESSAPAHRASHRADHVIGALARLLGELEIDAPVDVMGHDWGAYLSWCMALTRPDLLRRHVAISVGHPRAFALSGLQQMRMSSYMLLFVIPGVAERVLAADGFSRLHRWLADAHPDAETVIADLSRPGRLTSGLNWYRANLLSNPLRRWPRCRVPTLGVLPSEDKYLGERQMVASERYMDAAWTYVRLEGVGHWAALEAPDAVAEVVLPFLG